MSAYTDEIDALTPDQRQAFARLNRLLTNKLDTLRYELIADARDAGLDDDLVADHLIGWLNVAIEDTQRDARYLARPRQPKREPVRRYASPFGPVTIPED